MYKLWFLLWCERLTVKYALLLGLIHSVISNSFVVVLQLRIVMNLYSGVAMILLSRLLVR